MKKGDRFIFRCRRGSYPGFAGKINLSPFLAALLCALFAAPAPAAPESEALQKFVSGVNTLSAAFQQVQRDDKGVVLQASSGHLWLSRPGKFRWSYEKPYSQLMVCDGKDLWQYDPDLSQAMVRSAAGTLQGTPAQLLTERGALDQQFRIEDAGTEEGAQRVRLLPKAVDSDFKSIELWLRDGLPVRMSFHDPLGGVSEVSFTEVQANRPVDAKLFRFDPPKGTEIIRADAAPAK